MKAILLHAFSASLAFKFTIPAFGFDEILKVECTHLFAAFKSTLDVSELTFTICVAVKIIWECTLPFACSNSIGINSSDSSDIISIAPASSLYDTRTNPTLLVPFPPFPGSILVDP
jgi:hypothetical protein